MSKILKIREIILMNFRADEWDNKAEDMERKIRQADNRANVKIFE